MVSARPPARSEDDATAAVNSLRRGTSRKGEGPNLKVLPKVLKQLGSSRVVLVGKAFSGYGL
jgi:hypothetical protein